MNLTETQTIRAKSWMLELFEDSKKQLAPKPSCVIKRELDYDIQAYLDLHKRVSVGLSWFERLLMSESEVAKIVHDPATHLLIMYENKVPIGLLEMHKEDNNKEVRIIYFGILEEYIGRGYGDFFFNHAIAYAFHLHIARLYLSTCSLDHPRAIQFYQHQGLKIYNESLVDERVPKGYTPRYSIENSILTK